MILGGLQQALFIDVERRDIETLSSKITCREATHAAARARDKDRTIFCSHAAPRWL